jgi:hypothetical protein
MLELILPVLTPILNRLIPDQAERDKILAQAAISAQNADAVWTQSIATMVQAEAGSESKAARNWRPHFSYMMMFMIVWAGLIVPTANGLGANIAINFDFISTVATWWLSIYGVSRGAEKIAPSLLSKLTGKK